ncbi:Bromo-adjacent (BAH) domain-containing protein [Citrus sinensis]|nr:Bromo-adjacent (BAH) domain-containing protein [Citrus sinensis]
MGKRGRDRRASNLTSVSHKPISLREEKAGKKLVNTTNVKSKLKLEHLQRLAVWASSEISVPSLAALFGHRLASANEVLGLQPDPSFFSCQRCETVLQPGFNCTIRMEKNQVKSRRRWKKPKTSMQNRVVYKCHFCSHHNLKRGTPVGHMKEICPMKAKPSSRPQCGSKSPLKRSANTTKDTRSKDEVSKVDDEVLPSISKNCVETPPLKSRITLEGKKRRKSGNNNSAESESNSAVTDDKTVGVSSRRRRTSWISLKEIAERSEDDNGRMANLTIPFSFTPGGLRDTEVAREKERVGNDRLARSGQATKMRTNKEHDITQSRDGSMMVTGHSSTRSTGDSYKKATKWMTGFNDYVNNGDCAVVADELDSYLDEKVISRMEDFNILSWWKTNANRYPTLARIARDILAIPITTVASESAFNTSGRVVSSYHNKLHPSTLEALILLIIRGPGTLGDPLLLFGEGMGILSSNFDGDGEGTGTYAKHRGWVWGDWSPPLPSPLPSLLDSGFITLKKLTEKVVEIGYPVIQGSFFTVFTGVRNSGSLLIKTMKIISSMRLISLDQKTRVHFGDLPDIEHQETAAREQEDQLKAKRMLWKKNISPLDVSREEGRMTRSDQYVQAKTPGSCTSNAPEYYNILARFKALTRETYRDKWLERLLQGLQHNGNSFLWPVTAIAAVTALEKASHDALSSDFQKHNQKLHQLLFNLKSTALLALRFLKGKLEPSKILDMSPNELNVLYYPWEGLTAEETAKEESDESEQMQMTDARCSRCNECKVGLRDIIQAGLGDRYQVFAFYNLPDVGVYCHGHSWYASRNEASSLTIDGRGSAAKSIGIASLAAAKFDSLEKNLSSPREFEKSANDLLKKSSEAYMPVLEAHRSFSKSKTEENPDSSKVKKANRQS